MENGIDVALAYIIIIRFKGDR